MQAVIGTTRKGYGSILHDRVQECAVQAGLHAHVTVERQEKGTWVSMEWRGAPDAFARSMAPLIVEDLRSFLLMERMVEKARHLPAESQVLAWLEACQDARPLEERWKTAAAAQILDHMGVAVAQCRPLTLLPEGIVRFRMQPWQEELDRVVADALTLTQRKREMRPWANVLREWLDKQPICLEEVRVQRRNGQWALSGNRAMEGLQRLESMYSRQGVGVEERLVGILMGLIPRKVLWYGSRDDLRKLPLLSMVFGDRVECQTFS